ncbi:porphobilinogen synthase [Limnochorda sp.]|jgi:porphobilinogen synthase|uniref:porphobilinogen synthase n=1 Tax=Limnochorda sp. TaxID=1940279 RepID=UPI001795FFFB|nr:porphobilinogen synthase [Bacillota bacterium]MBO2519215.1 porphobilinogen synthase [Bacillota bacterium]NMA71060.1 porphobilinogen synthase [Bacillota bacterium]
MTTGWPGGFPQRRMRRLRRTETIRRMVRETWVRPDHLILPLFVRPGRGIQEPVPSMPGVFRWSVDRVVEPAREAWELGVPAVILFGLPERKDDEGSEAWREDGVVQQAVRALKEVLPELVVITDVCLCEYTSHGHCGVLEGGEVANDASLERLARTALSHARAGADWVAPSDMMDGRVGVIRRALDEAGFHEVSILAYSAKYASAFYGPFREAADSAPAFGDRRGYQMDPANAREALLEVELDGAEGADLVMVKPALPYLDVIHQVRQRTTLPVVAYQVSGEYAMLRAAGRLGWLDEVQAMRESLTAIRRAGADLIITYAALEYARAWRRELGGGEA